MKKPKNYVMQCQECKVDFPKEMKLKKCLICQNGLIRRLVPTVVDQSSKNTSKSASTVAKPKEDLKN